LLPPLQTTQHDIRKWDILQWDLHFASEIGSEMDKKLYSHQQAKLLELLRNLRVEQGLRQQDVADALGEPQSFVSKYEIGERRLDILELREICRVLGCSLTDFSARLDELLDS
jgi:ribosome-binding protein aMBF1 (putative translation factor)